MEGNPICVQIPWDKNPEALAKWAEGRTGFPWIDAIMTQLRQEGWIHHLARHAVACFLTRGDLWISWEEGMKVSVLTDVACLILKNPYLNKTNPRSCLLYRFIYNVVFQWIKHLIPQIWAHFQSERWYNPTSKKVKTG